MMKKVVVEETKKTFDDEEYVEKAGKKQGGKDEQYEKVDKKKGRNKNLDSEDEAPAKEVSKDVKKSAK